MQKLDGMTTRWEAGQGVMSRLRLQVVARLLPLRRGDKVPSAGPAAGLHAAAPRCLPCAP